MSSTETCRQPLLALKSAIDGSLANIFGTEPTHQRSSPPTNLPPMSRININPVMVDISAELIALELNDAQTKAITTAVNRTLLLLTRYWSNYPLLTPILRT